MVYLVPFVIFLFFLVSCGIARLSSLQSAMGTRKCSASYRITEDFPLCLLHWRKGTGLPNIYFAKGVSLNDNHTCRWGQKLLITSRLRTASPKYQHKHPASPSKGKTSELNNWTGIQLFFIRLESVQTEIITDVALRVTSFREIGIRLNLFWWHFVRSATENTAPIFASMKFFTMWPNWWVQATNEFTLVDRYKLILSKWQYLWDQEARLQSNGQIILQ